MIYLARPGCLIVSFLYPFVRSDVVQEDWYRYYDGRQRNVKAVIFKLKRI